jgi:hypothetical protein
MAIEITPEPTEAERAAIEAALAQESAEKAREDSLREPEDQ